MNILCGDVQVGKTFQLVGMLKNDDDSVLVVNSEIDKHRIIKQHDLDLYQAGRVVTFFEVIENKLFSMSKKSILIDDADSLLGRFLGPDQEIKAISLNGNVKSLEAGSGREV